MEEALSQEQCEKMREFLRALVTFANMLPAGTKPNVGEFMKIWREEKGEITNKRRIRRRWTSEEERILKKMLAEGANYAQVAVVLGRSRSWIRQVANKLGEGVINGN